MLILVGLRPKLIFEFEGFGFVCVMMVEEHVCDQYAYVIDIKLIVLCVDFDCIDEVDFLFLWFQLCWVTILGDDLGESMNNDVINVINEKELSTDFDFMMLQIVIEAGQRKSSCIEIKLSKGEELRIIGMILSDIVDKGK